MKKNKCNHLKLTYKARGLVADLISTTANRMAYPDETNDFKIKAQSELGLAKLKLEKYILKLQIKAKRKYGNKRNKNIKKRIGKFY